MFKIVSSGRPMPFSVPGSLGRPIPFTPATVTGLPLGGSAQYAGRTAKNIESQPGILGGIKFGRYLDAYPWFGWEMETSFSRNRIRGDQGRISPPIPGGPTNLISGTLRFGGKSDRPPNNQGIPTTKSVYSPIFS